AFDRAARLDAADRGAPAVVLERTVDVHRHRVARVRPGVAAVIAGTGLFLELELLDGVALRAVWQTREEARHGEAHVLGIVRLAQAAPCGVVRRGEDLGEIARVRELLPRIHAHERRAAARDERR